MSTYWPEVTREVTRKVGRPSISLRKARIELELLAAGSADAASTVFSAGSASPVTTVQPADEARTRIASKSWRSGMHVARKASTRVSPAGDAAAAAPAR